MIAFEFGVFSEEAVLETGGGSGAVEDLLVGGLEFGVREGAVGGVGLGQVVADDDEVVRELEDSVFAGASPPDAVVGDVEVIGGAWLPGFEPGSGAWEDVGEFAGVVLDFLGDVDIFWMIKDGAVDGGASGVAELMEERGFDDFLSGGEGEFELWSEDDVGESVPVVEEGRDCWEAGVLDEDAVEV